MFGKDHLYNLPIVDLKFHNAPLSSFPLVLSTDTKILKIWHPDTVKSSLTVLCKTVALTVMPILILLLLFFAIIIQGKIFANIEPGSDINDTCLIKDTGLVMMGGEYSKIHIFYVPALGPAPDWCSFLDNLTVWSLRIYHKMQQKSIDAQNSDVLQLLINVPLTGGVRRGWPITYIRWLQIYDCWGSESTGCDQPHRYQLPARLYARFLHRFTTVQQGRPTRSSLNFSSE